MPKLTRYLLFLILILGLVNLYVINSFADQGKVVTDLEHDILVLKHQNLKLELQLAQASSLTNLNSKLKQANFQSPKTITGLTPPSSVAMR